MLVFILNMHRDSHRSPWSACEHTHGQQLAFVLPNPIFSIPCALCALFSMIGSASLHLTGLGRHKVLSEAGARVPWRGRINIIAC